MNLRSCMEWMSKCEQKIQTNNIKLNIRPNEASKCLMKVYSKKSMNFKRSNSNLLILIMIIWSILKLLTKRISNKKCSVMEQELKVWKQSLLVVLCKTKVHPCCKNQVFFNIFFICMHKNIDFCIIIYKIIKINNKYIKQNEIRKM